MLYLLCIERVCGVLRYNISIWENLSHSNLKAKAYLALSEIVLRDFILSSETQSSKPSCAGRQRGIRFLLRCR